MNSVVLIGNLTKDPEISYTPQNQTAVCNFTIAINRPRRNGEGQGADYVRIIVWDRQAENCNRYLSKGRKVAIKGHLQTGSYKDRDGKTVYTTDVVADPYNGVEFLTASQGENSSREGRNADARDTYTPRANNASQGENEGFNGWRQADDDLPY